MTTTTPMHTNVSAEKKNLKTLALDFIKTRYLLGVLILVMVVLGIVNEFFWSSGNIENLLFRTAFVGLAACGMTLLIAAGALDLSVAGVIALAAVAGAKTMETQSMFVGILAGALVGLIAGLINGVVVTALNIPPFVATLGTMNLYLGAALIWTGGQVVPVVNTDFTQLANSKSLGLPTVFVLFIILAVITYLILNRTYFGRSIRAVGSNEKSARLAGISVIGTKLALYSFAGATFALAGVFMSGRLYSAEANMATGFEMNVIAAVVVGGTALRGGRGTVFGTVLGSLLFAVLANALNLLGVASYWQYVLTGAVLATVVALGARSKGLAEVRGAG